MCLLDILKNILFCVKQKIKKNKKTDLNDISKWWQNVTFSFKYVFFKWAKNYGLFLPFLNLKTNYILVSSYKTHFDSLNVTLLSLYATKQIPHCRYDNMEMSIRDIREKIHTQILSKQESVFIWCGCSVLLQYTEAHV